MKQSFIFQLLTDRSIECWLKQLAAVPGVTILSESQGICIDWQLRQHSSLTLICCSRELQTEDNHCNMLDDSRHRLMLLGMVFSSLFGRLVTVQIVHVIHLNTDSRLWG